MSTKVKNRSFQNLISKKFPNRKPVVERMDPMMIELMRNKTPQERLEISFRMWRTARTMIGAVLRQEHPDWTEEQLMRELAKRISHGVVDHERL